MERFALWRGEQPLCEVEVARSWRARSRGLLGRDGIAGAMLIDPASSVHSFGMRFDLDVAFLDRDLVVLRVLRVPRNRLTRPTPRAHSVLEAQAGAFSDWGLRPGDRLALVTVGQGRSDDE